MSNDVAPTDSSFNADQTDRYLQFLVELVNAKGGIGFGITLHVGGMLVSGELASREAYFEWFADAFGGAFGKALSAPEIGEAIKKSLSEFGKPPAHAVEDLGSQRPPQYVHLKNVHCFSPTGGPTPSADGVWWRGRISEVSGFILGSLQNSPS